MGTDQLIAALRAVTLFVCPDFEHCPTQQRVCTYFLQPGVEEALRSALAIDGFRWVGEQRFAELERRIPGVLHKMLVQTRRS